MPADRNTKLVTAHFGKEEAKSITGYERLGGYQRLRTADEVVMAIETSTIPALYMPDPANVSGSLYGYLEATGNVPMRALQHIRAINANAEQARLANIAPGTAMLHITRVSYLESGAAVELTHSFCRSDYYEFVAESRR